MKGGSASLMATPSGSMSAPRPVMEPMSSPTCPTMLEPPCCYVGGGPWPPWWQTLTLMFQKEVAERIVAPAGSASYGRLSVAAQWRSSPRIAMSVNRSAFVPPPKVTSAVVHITPGPMPEEVDPATLENLTQAAFGQRRKMLRSSLKSVPGALDALATLGIDSERRAETVSVDEFVNLARILS